MCDFCKIIDKELDAFVVCETDKNIAFLDYEPINEGHVLIVPKIHTDSIVNIPDDVLMDMNGIIRKMVCAYQKVYGAEGYSIMQNGETAVIMDIFICMYFQDLKTMVLAGRIQIDLQIILKQWLKNFVRHSGCQI